MSYDLIIAGEYNKRKVITDFIEDDRSEIYEALCIDIKNDMMSVLADLSLGEIFSAISSSTCFLCVDNGNDYKRYADKDCKVFSTTHDKEEFFKNIVFSASTNTNHCCMIDTNSNECTSLSNAHLDDVINAITDDDIIFIMETGS